jgi:hypothetical protein
MPHSTTTTDWNKINIKDYITLIKIQYEAVITAFMLLNLIYGIYG